MKDEVESGAKFFADLGHGAVFKLMELIQAEAPQERIDLQWQLSEALKAAARAAKQIEAMDGSHEG